METYKERIRQNYSVLTDGQKRVAEYILDCPRQSAFDSAAVVGGKAGVSETTVIRFCYAVGYEGFMSLQKDLQSELLSSQSSLDTYVKDKHQLAGSPHFYTKVMNQDRQNIARVMDGLDEEKLELAIEYLHKASKVLVVGTNASYAAAHWFSFTLNLMRGDTRIYRPDADNLAFLSMELEADWVVVILSFSRYANETLRIARTASARGATIITITDSLLAPVGTDATIVIPLEIEYKSTLDIAAPLFSLLNTLLASYAIKDYDRVKQRMEKYDETVEQTDVFIRE